MNEEMSKVIQMFIDQIDAQIIKEALQNLMREKEKPKEVGKAVEAKPASTKGRPKTSVDVGKLFACRKAGWSIRKIADELKCSEQTVRNYLNKGGEI